LHVVAQGGLSFYTGAPSLGDAAGVGLRVGDKGTHTSRTMMLDELKQVLAAASANADRADYARAIIEDNCLGKPTVASRRLSNQRIGELYSFDPAVPLFRILRSLWQIDLDGRQLLALLVALARDPLFLATAAPVISLREGAEFAREPMKAALRTSVGDRLNDAILDKVVRNAASSWTQSGHLVGRTLKRRRYVRATPASVAFALYIAFASGFRGQDLFTSGWVLVLDCSPTSAQQLAIAAKRLGLIDLRMAGEVLELGVERLDPLKRRA